jgi:hypothetical protein
MSGGISSLYVGSPIFNHPEFEDHETEQNTH